MGEIVTSDKFTFFESFYRSFQEMPDEERLVMYDSLCGYAFDGILPEFDKPILRIAWMLIEPHVTKNMKRSKTNASNASGPRRKPKQDSFDDVEAIESDIEIEAETTAKANAEQSLKRTENEPEAIAKANEKRNENDRNESEKQNANEPLQNKNKKKNKNRDIEIELEKEDAGIDWECEPESTFALQCLDAFNSIMGATYSHLPPDCVGYLERMGEHYTIEDVRKMIEFKRDEWQGTMFQKNLTPNTLFSVKHLQQYIHQSRQSTPEKKGGGRFDKYAK